MPGETCKHLMQSAEEIQKRKEEISTGKRYELDDSTKKLQQAYSKFKHKLKAASKEDGPGGGGGGGRKCERRSFFGGAVAVVVKHSCPAYAYAYRAMCWLCAGSVVGWLRCLCLAISGRCDLASTLPCEMRNNRALIHYATVTRYSLTPAPCPPARSAPRRVR